MRSSTLRARGERFAVSLMRERTLSPPLEAVGSLSRSGAAALGVLTLALTAFAALQYVMPLAFQSPPGLNPDGILHFQHVLFGRALPSVSETVYVWAFRLLLTLAWAAYAWAILEALEGRIPRERWIVVLVVCLSLGYAVFCPPSLSRDGYAYVAFGRMGILYGESPYAHTLKDLAARGDDAARVYPLEVSSTYGPLWTVLSYAIVGLTRRAGLWGQLVGFKLLAAISVIGAAFAGRQISAALSGREVERRHKTVAPVQGSARSPSPEQGSVRLQSPAQASVLSLAVSPALSLLAIGLNPLLIIEGAGNGHNDLLMMGLLLAGIACYARGRPWAGYCLLGCSVAIKFLSAAIVPWILMDHVRGLGLRKALRTALPAIGLALLPVILSYLPLRSGSGTGIVAGASHVYGLQQGGSLAAKAIALILLYVGLTLGLLRGRPGRYLAAWVVFASALAVVLMPVLFAWYVAWPLSVSLTRWDALHRKLTLVVSLAACWLLMLYSVPLRP